MPIHFVTPGKIDLDMALTFGVNSKINTSPIGFFGTGLKYAIATFLRTKHQIQIDIEGEIHHFSLQAKNYRDKDFDVIYLDDKPLGFTTELGKKWEIWMAFRELHSNVIDEKGITTDKNVESKENQTIITVTGPDIDKAYHERDLIFCCTPVAAKGLFLEIRQGSSRYLYYRGIRVHELPLPSLYTYNMLLNQTLTEDRTLASTYFLDHTLGRYVADVNCQSTLARIITAQKTSYEHNLKFTDTTSPSDGFLEATKTCEYNINLNESARQLAIRHQKITEDEIPLNSIQQTQLDSASDFLNKLGFPINEFKIKIVKMHQRYSGEARNGVILLSVNSFDRGTKYVAETLYEEMVHLKDGVFDETRAMQDVLIRSIMTLGEKLLGKPL